jgi:hypothetical protein
MLGYFEESCKSAKRTVLVDDMDSMITSKLPWSGRLHVLEGEEKKCLSLEGITVQIMD